MPPDFPGFIEKYRHLIELIYDELNEETPHHLLAHELYLYVDKYGIDLPIAVEVLIRKHGGMWDRDEPAPCFALDPLEADMMTALLEQADPATLASVMEESGHEPRMVASHLSRFISKWHEIRKQRWAQLFILEPPDMSGVDVEDG